MDCALPDESVGQFFCCYVSYCCLLRSQSGESILPPKNVVFAKMHKVFLRNNSKIFIKKSMSFAQNEKKHYICRTKVRGVAQSG